MIELSPHDPRLHSRGLAGWRRDRRWWQPSRLPFDQPLHPDLARSARMPAGGRLVLRTDAPWLTIDLDVAPAAPDWPPATVDVLADGALTARNRIHGTGRVRADLPGTPTDVQIWLPHFGLPRLARIQLPDGASFATPRKDGPRIVIYGSSISHCKEIEHPTQIWPVTLARAAGWDPTCLGFSGQCHLDPAVARHIRDTPATLIHLCVGINIHGLATFGPRSLAPALTGFIATIRDRHPHTPITVSTPITSPDREHAPNAVGWTLAQIRAEVARTTTELRDLYGDRNLHLIDGPSLLGPADADLLHDGLHPTPEGYRVLGDRLLPVLQDLLAHRAVETAHSHS